MMSEGLDVVAVKLRLMGNLKRAVADLIEHYIESEGGTFSPLQQDSTVSSCVVGFEFRNENGQVMGRFKGHAHLFDDMTPEQFVTQARVSVEG